MCDASRKFCAWAVTRYGKSRLSALSKYVVRLVFVFCARSGSLLHHLQSIFNAFNCSMLPKWSRWGGMTWYVLLRLLTLLCLTPLAACARSLSRCARRWQDRVTDLPCGYAPLMSNPIYRTWYVPLTSHCTLSLTTDVPSEPTKFIRLMLHAVP